MSNLCKYAIIRFMPFAETEEFANVGILLYAPKQGFVDFKLAPMRFARVTDFFDDLDGALYSNALRSFTEELERVRIFGRKMLGREQVNFFQEVTRYREGVMTFGGTSSMLCDDPTIALEALFERYIGRSFATKEYREQQMVKVLRHELKTHVDNVKFKQQRLVADYVPVNMPLVASIGNITKVIKPIAFDQARPLNLIEHGEQWISRVKRLIQAKTIKPEHMMFTVENPMTKDSNIIRAFNEVSNEMLDIGVNVTQFEDKKAIYSFASNLHENETFELIN
ncbi:DUF3037 domain-containing protein [Shewanella sp. D64]|uniref:DUF3037 domain-containing protein n=1 Tax=unclassified Shewanella TaxID=196818 RepID=UPI0022BA6D33|nr:MULTISPECIES: DUF3037 domain-containing protein [unclassified Shewanella]MEC4728885.1 DUF3037 domain-containing protein [Shewanella sp. D64]MEC4740759.1 DUF3037 domain-containing protein [Shewanella sp. E94]WBJ94499.1 DUF3037 domain-containing protein [Shewanella sp. MTB7]